MNPEIQIVITFAGILGAGISAYVGVRVALAEVKSQQKSTGERVDKIERRLDRLEEKYFK